MGYVVYSLIKNNRCVYVGCTNNIFNRIRKHKKDKDFDNYIIISHHKVKKDALLAERSIIKFLSIFGGKELLNAKYYLLSYEAQINKNINEDEAGY